MQASRIFAVIAAALLAGTAQAQSPASGHITGRAYVNDYFHTSYTWPAALKPKPLPQPAAPGNNAKDYMFPLFSAQQGDQPYGVVLIAEKLNVAGPHSTGIRNSSDFIARIAGSLKPGAYLSNINRAEKKNARGMIFDELTYLQQGKPAAVIATQVGQYLLVFKCSAQTPAELTQIEKSALDLRRLK